MAENSKIEWCHHTANFWIGCTEVSPECDNCYARDLAKRYGWAEWGNDKPRYETKLTVGKMRSWDKKALAAGERHRVFVNSLSDICDPFADQELRNNVVDAALQTPNLDLLLLTKRPQNYNKMFDLPPSNMWAGTTVGVKTSIARIRHLQEADFRVRFLSCEPLLEDLGTLDLTGIHWVICGGESGSKARPMQTEWAWNLRDQCVAAKVPFFMKQGSSANWKDYKNFESFPIPLQLREFPKGLSTTASETTDSKTDNAQDDIT